MEIVEIITRNYSLYMNKNTLFFGKLNPTLIKKVKFQPIYSNKFIQPKIYDLSDLIKKNESNIKVQKKILLDMFVNKQSDSDVNNKINKIKLEEIIGFGIVGIGFLALYSYSGSIFTFIPHQFQILIGKKS